MAFYEGLDQLSKAELEELVTLAKGSVRYHEESIVWVDAIAAQVCGEVAPYESAVADAAQALQQAAVQTADRPRALQQLAMCTHDLQVMTDAAQRSKDAALKVHPNLDEAKARLAEYEQALKALGSEA